MLDPTLPLGVFDSGLGGLTVVREITAALPHERVLYLGDTARVPYGARSPETVVRYAQACARALVQRGIKALVVACNTVSAVALDVLRVDLDLPVLGVIEPGARAAVAASRSLRIGVLGTAGTVASGAYPRAVLSISTRAEVTAHAAPLLVPLVEEGWIEGEVPHLAVRRYLEPLARARVDTVVLGCTHYPILRPILEQEARAMLGEVAVVDSAHATAAELSHMLSTRGLLRTRGDGDVELLVTDRPRTFAELTQRFLGGEEREAHVIDL
ncbi:MAG: glutamate racemase [Myxococcales bacterium]|nr:glutamate racemase [Myxococcales bacterium]